METTATNNIAGLLQYAQNKLRSTSETGLIDAQVLLAHVLEKPKSWLLAHPEDHLTAAQAALFIEQLDQLCGGAPLAYLTGRQEFFTLPIKVSSDVLIPRPETELLVEHAISYLMVHSDAKQIADIGTGSGCIAATLARHFPQFHFTAVDLSIDALKIAVENFVFLGVSQSVSAFCGNLLRACCGPFDLVCANLPYIPSSDLSILPVAQHEPRLALDGGPSGLDVIESLLEDAPRWLAERGQILLEIEERQEMDVKSLALKYLPRSHPMLIHDLAGKPRLIKIEAG